MNRRYLKRVSRPLSPFEVIEGNCIKQMYLPRKGNDKVVNTLDIDQFSGQKFMMNPQGFVMNDIMVFEQCQSDSVARSVLQRIKVLHPESISQDLTPEQMFASVIPANYGSPAEFISAHKSVASKFFNLREAEQKALLAKQEAELKVKQDVAISELDGAIPKSE